MEDSSKQDLLVQIARLYYIDNLSQQEIASIVHMSRSNISRMLKSCLDNGVIEIKINSIFARSTEMANAIKEEYGLEEVYICSSHKEEDVCRDNVGALAALYLKKKLKKGMKLGVTIGKTNSAVAKHLDSSAGIGNDVIQLIGGVSNQALVEDGQKLTESFANRLFGKAYILQAPLLVKTKLLRDLIIQERIIDETFQQFSNIDIALVGVDRVDINSFDNLVVTQADMIQLAELAAVANFAGRYFDINGNPCNAGINERIIGISLDELKKVPVVMAAVCGTKKTKATIGMLKSGLVNVLVLDESLARALMKARE